MIGSDAGPLTAILLQGKLDAEGRIDWSQFNVDSTIVQAALAAAGGPLGVKNGTEPGETKAWVRLLAMKLAVLRGGFSTKIHLPQG
jgi:hypothetical protein